jgi:hypothetical protein
MLTVRVPQSMQPPQRLPGGGLRLRFGDYGGGLGTVGDLSRMHAQFTTNFVDWSELPGALVITNGAIELLDTNATGRLRFYRVVED